MKTVQPIPLQDLPAIATAIRGLPPELSRCLEFLMLSVGRASEVTRLRRSEVSARTTWKPPSPLSNQPARPLSDAAQKVLTEALAAEQKGSNLVFPRRDGKEFDRRTLKRELQAIDSRLSGPTLRSTFAHWATETTDATRTDLPLAMGYALEPHESATLAKFGTIKVAQAKARDLLDRWALVCQ